MAIHRLLLPREWAKPSSAALAGSNVAHLSGQSATTGQYKVSLWQSTSTVKGLKYILINLKPVYTLCVSFPASQVTASARRRCRGRRRSPATPRSRARSTSSPSRWPAATPSATARAWCNDSRGRPAMTDSQAWSPPPGPGSHRPPPHPPFCRENWCLPAPAGSPPRQKPGKAVSPKQRLSLYLFILPFLLSRRSERRGAGEGEGGKGGKGGTRSCCEKVVETNKTVLVWRFLHDRRRPILGLHRDGAFNVGAFLPASTSRPGPSLPVNVFRSTDSLWSRWNVADSRRSDSTLRGVTFRSKRVRSLPWRVVGGFLSQTPTDAGVAG